MYSSTWSRSIGAFFPFFQISGFSVSEEHFFSPAAGAVCRLEVGVGGARRGARPPWP